MSRIKLLLDVVDGMRSLADSLQTIADAIAGDNAVPEQETRVTEATAAPTAKAVTLEQVRAVLAEKSHDGFTEDVRALLVKYGAQKLSAIDPRHYADLMRDAEELNDAGK